MNKNQILKKVIKNCLLAELASYSDISKNEVKNGAITTSLNVNYDYLVSYDLDNERLTDAVSSRSLIIYLNNQYSGKFKNELIEYIKSQVADITNYKLANNQ